VGLGELDAARSDCVRALELEPTLVDRGMLAFIDKRYRDARRDWEKSSAADAVQARELRPWLARLPARRAQRGLSRRIVLRALPPRLVRHRRNDERRDDSPTPARSLRPVT